MSIASRLKDVLARLKLRKSDFHVLERGRIVEHGTHEELISAQGLYGALWRGQQAEVEDAARRV